MSKYKTERLKTTAIQDILTAYVSSSDIYIYIYIAKDAEQDKIGYNRTWKGRIGY